MYSEKSAKNSSKIYHKNISLGLIIIHNKYIQGIFGLFIIFII